jgi:hypothetical protein
MRAGMRDARKTVAMPPRTQVSVGSGQGAITCAGYADKRSGLVEMPRGTTKQPRQNREIAGDKRQHQRLHDS